MKRTKRVTSYILLAALLLSLLPLSACGKTKSAVFDYAALDLSRYVSMSDDLYRGLEVSVNKKAEVNDDTMHDYLYSQDGFESVMDALTDTAPTRNSLFTFYYSVVCDGSYVDGLTNYASEPMTIRLGFGGNQFMADDAEVAFEDQILKDQPIPERYSVDAVTNGTVGEGKTSIISYRVRYEDENGDMQEKNVVNYHRFDANDTEDACAFLGGAVSQATIGTLQEDVYSEWDAGLAALLHYDLIVHLVLTSETTYDVPVTMPDDYDQDGELSFLGGKTITLHLIPLQVMQIKEDFRSMLMQYLEAQAESTYENDISSALQSAILTKCSSSVTAYPDGALDAAKVEVEAFYRQSYAEYVDRYGNKQFPTFTDYATALAAQVAGTTYDSLLEKNAKSAVEEYLIFYYLAERLGVTADEKTVEETYDYYLSTVSEDEAEQNAFLAEYDNYYGKGFFRQYVQWMIVSTDVLNALKPYSVITDKE